jgi:hypothetical protein
MRACVGAGNASGHASMPLCAIAARLAHRLISSIILSLLQGSGVWCGCVMFPHLHKTQDYLRTQQPL